MAEAIISTAEEPQVINSSWFRNSSIFRHMGSFVVAGIERLVLLISPDANVSIAQRPVTDKCREILE
jgi:hypothetical protein